MLPILGNTTPALDIVRNLDALFSSVNATADAPAFTYAHGKHINYNSFTTQLKSLLTKSRYQASQYSGHSFAVGELLIFISVVYPR